MQRNWQLKALLGLFLLPVVIAGAILGTNHVSFSTVQHGLLIDDPRPIFFSALYKLDGTAIDPVPTKNKWNLIYVAPLTCNSDCQARKLVLSKLQLALGADQDRLIISSSTSYQIIPTQADGNLLLLDPAGLYMMQYTKHSDAGKILKDIRRLLKYSHG
jgi:hypothetical protein